VLTRRAGSGDLGRSVKELKLLSEIGRAVSSTLDLGAVLSTVLNRSVGITGADAGAVFRYQQAERAFQLVEAVGWDVALVRLVNDLKVRESESAMGEAARRRMPIQLADVVARTSHPMRDAMLAGGFHAALVVPLIGPRAGTWRAHSDVPRDRRASRRDGAADADSRQPVGDGDPECPHVP